MATTSSRMSLRIVSSIAPSLTADTSPGRAFLPEVMGSQCWSIVNERSNASPVSTDIGTPGDMGSTFAAAAIHLSVVARVFSKVRSVTVFFLSGLLGRPFPRIGRVAGVSGTAIPVSGTAIPVSGTAIPVSGTTNFRSGTAIPMSGMAILAASGHISCPAPRVLHPAPQICRSVWAGRISLLFGETARAANVPTVGAAGGIGIVGRARARAPRIFRAFSAHSCGLLRAWALAPDSATEPLTAHLCAQMSAHLCATRGRVLGLRLLEGLHQAVAPEHAVNDVPRNVQALRRQHHAAAARFQRLGDFGCGGPPLGRRGGTLARALG